MVPTKIKHNSNLYNTLLFLSRNIFFYKEIKLPDTFETRIYLMFIHFSIMMITTKKRILKFDQKSYDDLFLNIENNIRELGYGDVAVNKKMKELNKILYDILLKLDLNEENGNIIKINHNLISKYFTDLNDQKSTKYLAFERYFSNFFNFCFELSLDNMIREAINFKN